MLLLHLQRCCCQATQRRNQLSLQAKMEQVACLLVAWGSRTRWPSQSMQSSGQLQVTCLTVTCRAAGLVNLGISWEGVQSPVKHATASRICHFQHPETIHSLTHLCIHSCLRNGRILVTTLFNSNVLLLLVNVDPCISSFVHTFAKVCTK